MAELLVQARGHWMDGMSQQEINNLPESRKDARDSRIQLGDIVVIKPDGWPWGNEENLPRYIVIKAPGVDVETVKHLTESLVDSSNPDSPKMKKKRKYQIPQAWMNQHLDQDAITLTPQEITWALDNIVEKTS